MPEHFQGLRLNLLKSFALAEWLVQFVVLNRQVEFDQIVEPAKSPFLKSFLYAISFINLVVDVGLVSREIKVSFEICGFAYLKITLLGI